MFLRKPFVYAASREPYALNDAIFKKFCQWQKPGFHRFSSVFFGFSGFWPAFPTLELRKPRQYRPNNTLGRSFGTEMRGWLRKATSGAAAR